MEETVALIKSCIISKKGGVPIEDLNGTYLLVHLHLEPANILITMIITKYAINEVLTIINNY